MNSFLGTLGIVGLILYYSIYVYLIVKLFKLNRNNVVSVLLLSLLIVSLISQYGTVSYYDFDQNFFLFLCFFIINKKTKGEFNNNERKN